MLRFKDNGRGITEEEKQIIFTHGYTTKAESHGFGLHNCANYMVEMGGKGPHAAFLALVQGYMPQKNLEKVRTRLSEAGRLALTSQYIEADPWVRLTLGHSFTLLLTSIKSRSSVIDYYAELFDLQEGADPFLHNIRPSLRDPKTILKKEIASRDTETKILGLKALSMLLNRIPPKRLHTILTQEESPLVRIAIYQIIENASSGVYADLFDPILALLPDTEDQEALQAFKALVATGRHPVFHLIEIINNKCPTLIPAVKHEVSSLSKTAFLFIQDIALNPHQYTKGVHLEINLACIFGMIKKRPERVAAIILKFIKQCFFIVFKMNNNGFFITLIGLIIMFCQI